MIPQMRQGCWSGILHKFLAQKGSAAAVQGDEDSSRPWTENLMRLALDAEFKACQDHVCRGDVW